MSIDERIERLADRVDGLVLTAELHQKEFDALRKRLELVGEHIQTDAEDIRALARIAEIHERRREAIEGDQP